ncbi:MAG: 30S ribosomal protein S9 [Candidatus Moranbacteria bacterium]|nr:30S ribosomal protein S9 [Candidatus Moranbacteria bacterium]
MTTKKNSIKKKSATAKADAKYFAGTGRRKSSVARVRLYDRKKGEVAGIGKNTVNDRVIDKYFVAPETLKAVMEPLVTVGAQETFVFTVVAKGGGTTGQADATRLGIARALVEADESYRPALKASGFLKRDARVVERKKPGLRKARRAPQWSKR